VEADTFQPVHEAKAGNVILLAVHLGKTRLIDNQIL
jgi:pantothenate synthetase